MKRFPVYDPPEYVNWKPEPALVAQYPQTVHVRPERHAVVQAMSLETKLALYAGMVRTRLHDVMLKRWVRQGIISKAWLGTGEEASTVGPVHALKRDVDIVAPMIRNAGACCEMGMPVADMLRGYLGTYDSPSKGRDGHVGNFRHRVLQPISTIGNMPPVTAGIALGFALRGENGVALTWIGDGSVKQGGTHEALNFASVRRLPVIFIVQNNQVALGTEVHVHHAPTGFASLHDAYGCAGEEFDGNNVLDGYAATALAAERARSGDGPVILVAETFRMGGHATHDEQEARDLIPDAMFETWGKRDPIGLYEQFLLQDGVTQSVLDQLEQEVSEEVDRGAEEALESREHNMPAGETALDDVYAGQRASKA